jgi:ribosome-binding factor A
MEVSDILARAVHDPGIGFVTLTRVRVTEDLQQARIFYTALGDVGERRKTARALDRAQPFIRRALGERLRLRRVPELTFAFDQSIAHQARVEELIEQIHREDTERAAEHEGDKEQEETDHTEHGGREEHTELESDTGQGRVRQGGLEDE